MASLNVRAVDCHVPHDWMDKMHTCIGCHKGIAHRLPNMEGVEIPFGAPIEMITSTD
jgi:nitrate/TMAO reductase-like tetraheme cytochrome c subunit